MYIIIGRQGCEWCEKAIKLLETNNKTHVYYSLNHCGWLRPLMVEAGYTTVPLIFSPDNKVIGGYTELKEIFGE